MFDRDIDPPPAPARRGLFRRLLERDHPPIQRFQRLVANPFLAVFGFIAWLGLLRVVSYYERVEPTVLVVFLVLPLAYLFQFHCLDCGTTARLSRWRAHRCAAVEHRRAQNRPRFLRGPAPPLQTVLWMLAFAFVSVLALVASSLSGF
jgi:hypothetical protein